MAAWRTWHCHATCCLGIELVSYPRKKLITFAATVLLVLIAIYFAQLKYSQESLKPAQVEHVTCVDLVGG